MNGRHSEIPNLVLNLCLGDYGAWIVGSSVDFLLKNDDDYCSDTMPKDWDVMVRYDKYLEVVRMCKEYHPKFNSFGGIKININNESIDIWPMTIEEFMATVPKHKECKLYQPKTRMLIKREWNEQL